MWYYYITFHSVPWFSIEYTIMPFCQKKFHLFTLPFSKVMVYGWPNFSKGIVLQINLCITYKPSVLYLVLKHTVKLLIQVHLSKQLNCRCSWSIACQHCPNYIFIPNLTPDVNWLSFEIWCTYIGDLTLNYTTHKTGSLVENIILPFTPLIG